MKSLDPKSNLRFGTLHLMLFKASFNLGMILVKGEHRSGVQLLLLHHHLKHLFPVATHD